MRKPLHASKAFDLNLEFKPVINVVTAYADFACGQRAIETYSNLVLRLGHEFQFKTNMWKFEVLQHPKLQDMAATDAREAHIIIISTRGEAGLPDGVKHWIDHWVNHTETEARALVALFDTQSVESPDTGPICSYLRDVARQGKMDFFSQPEETPGAARPARLSGAPSPAPRSFWPDGIMDPEAPPSRWGINE